MIEIVLYGGPRDGQPWRVGKHLPDVLIPPMPLISIEMFGPMPDPRPVVASRYSVSVPARYDGSGRLIYDWRD